MTKDQASPRGTPPAIRVRRTFSQDWSAHGFFYAIWKRFFSYTVGGESLDYDELLKDDPVRLELLFSRAISEKNLLAACWMFEAMVFQRGELEAWRHTCGVISRMADHDPGLAAKVAEYTLRTSEDPVGLAKTAQDPRTMYILGKVFQRRARENLGVNQWAMEANRTMALELYTKAREKAPEMGIPEGSAPADASDAAKATAAGIAGGILTAAVIATAYEQCMGLEWKARAKAMSSSWSE